MENNQIFNYSYSAKEQEEIKAIRKKYLTNEKTEDNITKLRRLDLAVTQKATTVSLVFGIVGALILGTGMSLAMTNIGQTLGLSAAMAMIIGVLVGVIGMLLVGAAYPVYNRILKKEREKIAPEIIRLTDMLIK